jgi:hypothetical protein
MSLVGLALLCDYERSADYSNTQREGFRTRRRSHATSPTRHLHRFNGAFEEDSRGEEVTIYRKTHIV